MLSEKLIPRNLFYKIALAFATVVLIAMMFPKGESIESEVSEGTVWLNDDLIAEISFPIIKSEEIYQSEFQRLRHVLLRTRSHRLRRELLMQFGRFSSYPRMTVALG